MKFTAAILALAFGSAAAAKGKRANAVDLEGRSIKADSKIGQKLMANARKLENADEEVDFTWVANYSLKFQGCHHVSQWNDEANGEDDVRIQTKRLVRFRLCPTDSCSLENAGGCDSGYGDYVIDMDLFLQAYWENKQQFEEWNCEYYANNVCDCENADNEEYCEYDCYMDNGLDYCVDKNPYADDEEDKEEFEVDKYLECGEWDIPEERRKGRKLEEEEVQYFIGPYCSAQGGKIFLGVFTDETCTNFADDEDNGLSHTQFYAAMTGESLPYSETTLCGMDCISCHELPENNGNDDDQNQNGDEQDEDNVIEMCEMLYEDSGKCESGLSGVAGYPNENACNYIEGIKIIRKDGTVKVRGASGSKTAAVFIGIFAASFFLLGGYVYYLKTKLDRAKVNLSE